jgi:hypothetical protein
LRMICVWQIFFLMISVILIYVLIVFISVQGLRMAWFLFSFDVIWVNCEFSHTQICVWLKIY